MISRSRMRLNRSLSPLAISMGGLTFDVNEEMMSSAS